jgi:hypothetical protein
MAYECIEQSEPIQLPDDTVVSHHRETTQTRLDKQAGGIVHEKHKRPFRPGLRVVQRNRPVVRAGTTKVIEKYC